MPRNISWIRAAQKAVLRFPVTVQREIAQALDIAASGEKSDTAKPMKGMGAGVLEIVLRHQGDAFRAVYAVKIGDDIWVVHAFQKKSKKGVQTPKHVIDLIKPRLRMAERDYRERKEAK